MKKFIVALFLFFFISYLSASDNYSELEIVKKPLSSEETYQILNKIILGYDLEISFMDDCINHLKLFKEKNNKPCTKILDRQNYISTLMNIFSNVNFRTNLNNLANEIEKKIFTDVSENQLMDKLNLIQNKIKELGEKGATITFLLKNL